MQNPANMQFGSGAVALAGVSVLVSVVVVAAPGANKRIRVWRLSWSHLEAAAAGTLRVGIQPGLFIVEGILVIPGYLGFDIPGGFALGTNTALTVWGVPSMAAGQLRAGAFYTVEAV